MISACSVLAGSQELTCMLARTRLGGSASSHLALCAEAHAACGARDLPQQSCQYSAVPTVCVLAG